MSKFIVDNLAGQVHCMLTLQVKGQASSAELSELRYIHSQEIMELKHNFSKFF